MYTIRQNFEEDRAFWKMVREMESLTERLRSVPEREISGVFRVIEGMFCMPFRLRRPEFSMGIPAFYPVPGR